MKHAIIDLQSKTAVFLGCILAGQYPTEGKKVLDLLLAMDVKVQMSNGLVCCGGSLMWVGYRKQTEKAFETNIDILINARVEQRITPCPGVWAYP